MKTIFNIIEDVSFESGGLRTAIINLHEYINENADSLSSKLITNLKEDFDSFIEFKTNGLGIWNYSSYIEKFLDSNNNNVDLFHLHGAWMHTQFIGSKVALKNNIPYIMTLHGMIEPWYLKQKAFKKKVYIKLVLEKMLKNATVIHAITRSEKENIFKLTGHKNIIEIPNLIHYTKIPDTIAKFETEDYFLFLSRLHPGKRVDLVIQALNKIENKTIKLKIAGTENTYSRTLKKLIKDLKLENRVEFLGSVFGNEKYELFANAKAFILPSFSEAIGMVNLEAAVCKTPVITSNNTGLNTEWNNNGGILINSAIDDLITSMNEASSWSDSERKTRGDLLRDYVIKNYSWENKGDMWQQLYNSI